MKKIQIFTIALFLLTTAMFAQTKWEFDKSHSKIGFSVTHLVISQVEGNFKNYSGTITTESDNFENAKVAFEADVNSIFTDNEKRDAHLQSPDFFDAKNFPKLTFESTSFKKVKDGQFIMVGNLTIRGITKEVSLDVKYNGTIKDPWGNTKAGFNISGEINRFDYGLKWNAAIETGGLVVSENVKLNIDVELAKAK